MTHPLFIRSDDSFREASPAEVLDLASELISQRFRAGTPVLSDPELTRNYLRHQIGTLPYQVFGALLLDHRRRLIRSEILFRGTIDAVSVHPREVARVVVACDASAVLLFRNARAEYPNPTDCDSLVVRRIRDALSLIDVRVVDYLIVGTITEYSFAQAGALC